MDEDPFSRYGLKPVELADRAVLEPYFSSLAEPLSDYTFSQLYTWHNSLRILWKQLDGHLCVFANGTGDLTLLMPPIGDTASDKALRSAYEVMDDYNALHNVPDRSRVEYASEELLARFDRGTLQVEPMGADYLYDTQRMIDLAGGDLASKRQAKNRFMRNYAYRVEPYSAALHRDDCLQLLESWKDHQDIQHDAEPSANAIKRAKESIATKLCLDTVEVLGLSGMVVYVEGNSGLKEGQSDEVTKGQSDEATRSGPPLSPSVPSSLHPSSLKGFTFGEPLGSRQTSITIEKTDLMTKGLAQFIFSEFCRVNWADRPLVNVGDDWGLETLAWTKQSYRPIKMLQKYVLRRNKAIMIAAA
ncbi:MAG TPA: phosphatidylglycerol lysyltransferase domain-containing protein [Tepidisphaeraceae bacterium]|nr:phosphatidylglycerol lysyltransferase domain-containing protein [Tepidisphaeraceae bacterium]